MTDLGATVLVAFLSLVSVFVIYTIFLVIDTVTTSGACHGFLMKRLNAGWLQVVAVLASYVGVIFIVIWWVVSSCNHCFEFKSCQAVDAYNEEVNSGGEKIIEYKEWIK